jgi:glycerol-3-phosphate dehydrogenase (NAD(P)+)
MTEPALSVLGCGRWGSFILWYGSRCGMRVTGWEPPDSEPFRSLAERRSTEILDLPEDVALTTDLGEAVGGAGLLAVAVPAQRFRGVAARLSGFDLSGTDLVLCMKGLEAGTGMRLSEIASEEGVDAASVSAWVGPGHPQQLVRGVPSCMLVASADPSAAERVASVLGSDLVRFYRSRDLPGCETGAAAKNVIGIAGGILDGLGMTGLKGALMARAPQEIARLVSVMGGDWRSVYGLSHLGDYEATLFSEYSRNRAYGQALARGGRSEGLAEGVETSRAMERLGTGLGVELPITSAVRMILDGELSPESAIEVLFGRPEREEFPDSF